MNAPMEVSKNKTLYDLLATRPDATAEELEAAYRSAVERLKPETDAGRPDALNTLRLLREAYHILSDQQQRTRYDAWMRPLEGAVDTFIEFGPSSPLSGLIKRIDSNVSIQKATTLEEVDRRHGADAEQRGGGGQG